MAFRSLSQKILATSFVAAVTAGGVYSFTVSRRVSLVDKNLITRSEDIPESFISSKSAGEILNAKKHVYHSDWRFIILDIPPEHEDVSDQVLLAKFVKGFFGGAVLRPERLILQTVGLNLVHFSILFGVFQVLDSHVTDLENTKNSTKQTESYVDFGFGSDSTRFAGVHRFTVVRQQAESNSKEQQVQIHFQHMTCNPIVNKPLGPRWMLGFHEMYADYLFRDGVAEIKRWMGQ
ncbi:hypothetical protein FAUST_9300 [Fusarium austroamericanum]|uniref:Uncharacterized protein n=1 Tax=Fusarium austroamericanum TaxID=282268 RepID=A0AAN5Z3C2_FUSAU|nr:hypothetical protein FAUST_9300 [Fusarium austroamericanum]